MILRPYGVVIDGVLEQGLELVLEGGVLQEIRPHTGVPDLYVVTPAFINAHSHLEYRGMMGKITEPDYPSWIREITRLKKLQTAEEIREDCLLAARENVATGVNYIFEHSDRPHAAEAMEEVGLHGHIFQEVITIFEHQAPEEKLILVEQNSSKNRSAYEVSLNPHAFQTVDRKTLKYLASLNTPLSIHAAETPFENEFTRSGTGPIADFYRANDIPFESTGKSVVESLDDLGLLRGDTQLVHCCALEEGDIEIIRKRNVAVAHCPRSNRRLQCPPAAIRELLDADIRVGLGLDSAASSGPIDMFAEMRDALRTSIERRHALTPEEIWQIATNDAYFYFKNIPDTSMEVASMPNLLKVHVQGATCTEDLIELGRPELVEWV